MTNEEFHRLLKQIIRSCVDSDSSDMIRTLALKKGEYQLAWYGFEEVAYEEPYRRGRWYFKPEFTFEGERVLLALRAYSMKRDLFDAVAHKVGCGWIVPFTVEQQRHLAKLRGEEDEHFHVALPRLRKELTEAGLKQHFWLFSYEHIDSVGFFNEADAVLARCIIDDFDFEGDIEKDY